MEESFILGTKCPLPRSWLRLSQREKRTWTWQASLRGPWGGICYTELCASWPVVMYSARLHCVHSKFSHRRTRVFLSKPYQTPIRPQSFWVCSIPFCRTRCGMTLRDFSRPNTIVEAGWVKTSCFTDSACESWRQTCFCTRNEAKQSALRWLAMFVAKLLFPEDYSYNFLQGFNCLQTLLTCTWWFWRGWRKLLVASFWNSTWHRTIIQILSRPFKKESSSLSSFPSHLSALIVIFWLYYLYVYGL